MTESENIYKVLYDHSLDAILLTAPDGKIYAANHAACKMLQRTEEEICRIGRNGLVDIDDPRLNELLEERKRTTRAFGEITMIRKDGTKFPVELTTSVFTTKNGQRRTTIIIRDISSRHDSEKRLNQALNWQHAIFEASRDAIFISDQDARFVAVNRAASDLTGYSHEQLLKMRIPDIHDSSDLNAFKMYQKKILAGEEIITEAKILRSDGTKIDTEFNNRCMSVDAKVYMHTTARDITPRKQAEASLRESEIRFRSIFENSLLGILISSPEGRLIQVNHAFASMYGYENPEVMLDEVSSVKMLYAHSEEREEFLKTLDRKGKMEPSEFEVVRRDGTHFFIHASARGVRDTEGKLLYIQGVHLDVTEHKQVVERIRNVSRYTRNLIEASVDPFVTISAEGKITDVNKATEKATGILRNKLIGSDFSDYFTEPDKAREGYMKVFTRGVVKDYPLTILHKCGRITPVLYNATLFRNEAGEVQGVFAEARDITVQKKMEEELRDSQEILEKLNQHLHDVWENEKSQIALNLHDDLGQKFTAMIMDLAWLKGRIGVQSTPVRKKLKEMNAEINETIEGLKEISTLLRPAILYDLGLVPAFSSQLIKFEKQSGIKCKFLYDTDEFKLDERLSLILFRILQECLTNIARHSGASNILVTLKLINNKISLTVKDDGVGIDMNKINSPDSMGIAGIKERSNMVHGSVLIKGKKGIGTIIKVTIPLTKTGRND